MKIYSLIRINIVVILMCSLFSSLSFSQLAEDLKYKHFSSYSDYQICLIKNNWDEFFLLDIADSLNSEVEMSPLFLDSYGCIYPDLKLFKGLKHRDFMKKNRVSDVKQSKYSLYQFFSLKKVRDTFLKNIPDPSIKSKYDDIFSIYNTDFKKDSRLRRFVRFSKFNDTIACQIEKFNELWKEMHEPIYFKKLDSQFNDPSKKYKNVQFFIHGFNVPQSLATIQAQTVNEVFDSICRNSKDSITTYLEETLIVPIYWPSNNKKKKKIGGAIQIPSKQENKLQKKIKKLKRSGKKSGRIIKVRRKLSEIQEKDKIKSISKAKRKFSIKNKSSIFNGGINNMRKFTRYTQHAYDVSFLLRRILNELDDSANVSIFAHSYGTIIATSSIINTVSKLQGSNSDIVDHFYDRNLEFDTKEKRKFDKFFNKNNLSKHCFEEFKKYPIPTRSINMFLSAPAIPGINTFIDMQDSLGHYKNKNFYVSANLLDPMLNKSMIQLLHYFNIAASTKKGSTTFGSDYLGELDRVQNMFSNYRLDSNLFFEQIYLKDHDVFLYLENQKYLKLVNSFLELEEGKERDKFEIFKKEYQKLYDENFITVDKDRNTVSSKYVKTVFQNVNYRERNIVGEPLKKIIFDVEKKSDSRYSDEISNEARKLITYVKEPYLLVLLERSMNDDESPFINKDSTSNHFFRSKIIDETSRLLNLTMAKQYPYYNYETKIKKPIKFISIRTGNDLFIFNQKENHDRDYTGSVLIEVGTDYLNTLRRRPIKSYQTLFYGFDVFTPQFKDSTKFKKFDDQDSLDRPHASFQYFGWSKKCLSKHDYLRWTTTIKFGKIGGRVGEKFQTALHQDISKSLRPKGWDAQISNGGRLGISLETKHEYQFTINENNNKLSGLRNLYWSPMLETMLGTYMTKLSVGFQLGNKEFLQNNHNFINHRPKYATKHWLENLRYNFALQGSYVKHNTMLEGFGIFTSEKFALMDDELTPESLYVLESEQIKRFIYTGNFSISYTAMNFTMVYNYFLFSPETKLGSLRNDKHPGWSTPGINIGKRLHRFTEIGLTFNLR